MSPPLVKQIIQNVQNDPYWKTYFKHNSSQSCEIHLAIFVEPYLSYVLNGKKTVESRFSSNKIAPYQKVRKGDVVLLKQSGGPVVGICEVSQVWSYILDPASLNHIKKEFTKSLCAQDLSFWSQRKHASYATLMKIKNVISFEPIFWKKRDRRGWVILDTQQDKNLKII